MMTNLFSIFDPSSITPISMNWMSMFLIIMFTNLTFWLFKSKSQILISKFNSTINKELKTTLKSSNYPNFILILLTLFILIFVNNLMGLFPYIFTSTSHMMITLSLALPLWLMSILMLMTMNTMNFLAHLVPQSTPSYLMSFMVMIESISNIIRPMTLAIRLTANMIAGHLLITLLSSINEKMSIFSSIIITISSTILMTLELAVAVIQAYVFMTLMSLYLSEIN
nr:ATP synthase F0 subunit 6 [Glomeridesmus spelaeus]